MAKKLWAGIQKFVEEIEKEKEERLPDRRKVGFLKDLEANAELRRKREKLKEVAFRLVKKTLKFTGIQSLQRYNIDFQLNFNSKKLLIFLPSVSLKDLFVSEKVVR